MNYHDYAIKAFLYNDKGSLTDDYVIKYADTPEQAENIYNELNKEKVIVYNDEGEIIQNYKKYKVYLQVLARKNIDDVAGFFNQFKA